MKPYDAMKRRIKKRNETKIMMMMMKKSSLIHMDASIVHTNEHPNSKKTKNNNNTNITMPILSFNEIRLNEY